jgi:hypothetical protein
MKSPGDVNHGSSRTYERFEPFAWRVISELFKALLFCPLYGFSSVDIGGADILQAHARSLCKSLFLPLSILIPLVRTHQIADNNDLTASFDQVAHATVH